MQSNDPLVKLTQTPQYARFMRFLFWMALVATVGGLALKFTGRGISLLIMGAGTLAVWCMWFFVYRPYKPLGDEQADKSLLPLWHASTKLTGLSLSTLCMGGLFKLCHWPGGWFMLLVGAVSLVVAAIIFLVYSRKREQFII